MSAPTEFYDEDYGREHLLRKDRHATPAKAKSCALHELDAHWTDLRCDTVWLKPDLGYIEDAKADGIKEPYDGWPWTFAKKGEADAVAYWRVYIRSEA